MDNNFNSPKQMYDMTMSATKNKLQSPFMKVFVLGIMAGMFIAFGAEASSFAIQNITNTGVAKLVAGCVFPVGLMMIVFVGGELFTGDCLMAINCYEKEAKPLKVALQLIIVFLSNFIGALIVVFLVFYSKQFSSCDSNLAAMTIKTAVAKNSLNFFTAFCSGILCNILVCVAVLMAASAKDIAGKVWAIFFPILAFVISGFEHCVANMYYIPAGILASTNPEYAQKAQELCGVTESQIAQLHNGSFLINNLLPVTLGNIVGGMVFVGLPLFLLHRNKK